MFPNGNRPYPNNYNMQSPPPTSPPPPYGQGQYGQGPIQYGYEQANQGKYYPNQNYQQQGQQNYQQQGQPYYQPYQSQG
jgi:hypothetical protein